MNNNLFTSWWAQDIPDTSPEESDGTLGEEIHFRFADIYMETQVPTIKGTKVRRVCVRFDYDQQFFTVPSSVNLLPGEIQALNSFILEEFDAEGEDEDESFDSDYYE